MAGLALPFRAVSQNSEQAAGAGRAARTEGILPVAPDTTVGMLGDAFVPLSSPSPRPPALIKLICIDPNELWREETERRARVSSSLPLGSLPGGEVGAGGAGAGFARAEDVRRIRRRNPLGQRRKSSPAGRKTGVERADASSECHLGAGMLGRQRNRLQPSRLDYFLFGFSPPFFFFYFPTSFCFVLFLGSVSE